MCYICNKVQDLHNTHNSYCCTLTTKKLRLREHVEHLSILVTESDMVLWYTYKYGIYIHNLHTSDSSNLADALNTSVIFNRGAWQKMKRKGKFYAWQSNEA